MKSILLIGIGRFGRRLAHRLFDMNVEVMAVDKVEERAEMAAPFADRVLVGDASNMDFLKSLGVRNFDTCIVAIGDDFLSSLEVTSLLKELGARRVIARAARDTQEKFLLKNGADEVVYPEKQMANWLSLHVSSDNLFDYLELSDGYGIYEFLVPESWIGKTIGGLDIRNRFHMNILAVRSGSDMMIAVGTEYMFEHNQSVIALGSQQDVQKCLGEGSERRRSYDA